MINHLQKCLKYIFTKNRGSKRGLEDNIELINICFPHSISCFIQSKKYLYKAKNMSHIYFYFQSEDMYSPTQLSANEIGSGKNIQRLHLSENVHQESLEYMSVKLESSRSTGK